MHAHASASYLAFPAPQSRESADAMSQGSDSHVPFPPLLLAEPKFLYSIQLHFCSKVLKNIVINSKNLPLVEARREEKNPEGRLIVGLVVVVLINMNEQKEAMSENDLIWKNRL